MSVHTNIHLVRIPGEPKIESSRLKDLQSAHVRISENGNHTNIFFDDVETIERLSEELRTLAMEIREEGWRVSE